MVLADDLDGDGRWAGVAFCQRGVAFSALFHFCRYILQL
jgi:hypothetical protein